MKRIPGETCPINTCPCNDGNGKCEYYLCHHGIFDIDGNFIDDEE